MLNLLAALFLSFASASEWTETARESDCVFFKGVAQGKVLPVRAVCEWSIPAARLHAIISPANRFQEYLSGVSFNSRVKGPPGVIRVLQVHVFSGVTDRAAFMDYTVTDIPGGKRYAFQKAPNQDALPDRYVEIKQNVGKWEVTSKGTGSRLVFENAYDAGGYLPGVLVRWFQGAGTRQVLTETKAFAEKGG